MSAAPYEVLEAARTQAGMSFEELWIGYFTLGGEAALETVRSYLQGADVPPRDYDLLAAAINEHFVGRGEDHPVPYHDELP